MKFYLSTIADVSYDYDNHNNKYEVKYKHIAGPIAKKYGFGLELAEFCLADNCQNPGLVLDFFEENTKQYSKELVLHAPYNDLYPHAIEPLAVDICKNRYKMSYELCKKYSCNKMIVHANYVKALYYESWFIEKQIEFWKEFLKNNSGSTQICLENVMEEKPELITEIIKGVNDERLKMCLDIGHANLHTKDKNIINWLEKSLPYISHLHIHNNNGNNTPEVSGMSDLHKGLNNGIIDYDKILNIVNEYDNNITATIESSEIEESINFLKEKRFL